MLQVLGVQVMHIGPVSLSVHAGECVALSGESGSGKSILLRALIDLIPHQGDVVLDNINCQSMSATEWRSQVGYLPAESAWWSERVGDHFDDACQPQWLKALGFDQTVMDWEVARCSTGERQRLALLRLLCRKPRVLLLDEPTASLDRQNVSQVEALITEYQQLHQIPVLWVSHDPEQIQRVAQHEYRLIQGNLQEVSI